MNVVLTFEFTLVVNWVVAVLSTCVASNVCGSFKYVWLCRYEGKQLNRGVSITV